MLHFLKVEFTRQSQRKVYRLFIIARKGWRGVIIKGVGPGPKTSTLLHTPALGRGQKSHIIIVKGVRQMSVWSGPGTMGLKTEAAAQWSKLSKAPQALDYMWIQDPTHDRKSGSQHPCSSLTLGCWEPARSYSTSPWAMVGLVAASGEVSWNVVLNKNK